MREAIGDLARLAGLLFQLQRIDELNSGEKPNPVAMLLNRLYPKGGGQMRLAGARSFERFIKGSDPFFLLFFRLGLLANQHEIVDKSGSVGHLDQRFVRCGA